MTDSKSEDEFAISDEEDMLAAVEEVEQLLSSQIAPSSQAPSSCTLAPSSQTLVPSSQTLATSSQMPTSSAKQSFKGRYNSSQPYQNTPVKPEPLTRAPLGEITPNRSTMTHRATGQGSSQTLHLDSLKSADSEYKLTFGKYKGNTLHEVPRDYISWIEQQSWISDPGLKTALEAFKNKESLALKKALKKKKKKTPYVFNFSSHIGKRLDEVPPSFINYLQENPEITDKRPDLEAALQKFTRKKKISQISQAKSSNWQAPPAVTTDHRRYYRNGKQMWIAESDTLRFFGVEPGALLVAGLAHCRTRPRAFWVHQVFSFAAHFGTTGDDTPTKALNKFKAKNYSVGG